MQTEALILGSGVTGLSVGYRLSEAGAKVTIYDTSPHLGGLAGTFAHRDCLLDFGPHKIFSLNPAVIAELKRVLGEEDLLVVQKKSKICLDGTLFHYPLRASEMLLKLNPVLGLRCMGSYLASLLRRHSTKDERSYADWIERRFGRAIFELIFAPYARKLWGDPHELDRELAETRIAVPNLWEMILQMLVGIRKQRKVISVDHFYYPRQGALEICRGMTKIIENHGNRIFLGRTLNRVLLGGTRVLAVEHQDGTIQRVDYLISTIPFVALLRMLGTTVVPPEVWTAANNLRTRHLILSYIIVNKPLVLEDCWLFFPEEKYVFNRISEQKQFSPYMVPPALTVLCAEITCEDTSALWHASDAQIFERVVNGLQECKLLRREDVLEHFTKRIPNVYPIYDLDYKQNTRQVLGFLDSIENLFSVGRQGGFNYIGTMDCLEIGMTTSDFVLTRRAKKEWESYRRRFESFEVID